MCDVVTRVKLTQVIYSMGDIGPRARGQVHERANEFPVRVIFMRACVLRTRLQFDAGIQRCSHNIRVQRSETY